MENEDNFISMTNISVIIVAHASPPHLTETLNSVKDWVAEIIIVDIGLSEHVKKELSAYSNLRIETITEKIPYVELIRERSKAFAKNEYILILDPDEIVEPQLAQFIQENYQKYDFLSIPRKNIIFGKWIQHSRWWPDYQIRLFKKDHLTWPTTLHAQPITTGNEHKIEASEGLSLLHYNYEDLDEYISKMMRYAKADASNAIDKKEDLTLSKTIQQSLSEFISRYFADKGYKDGLHGFTLAWLQMMYYFFVYFYFNEVKKYQVSEENIPQASREFFKRGLLETTHWINQEHLNSKGKKIQSKLLQKLLTLLD